MNGILCFMYRCNVSHIICCMPYNMLQNYLLSKMVFLSTLVLTHYWYRWFVFGFKNDSVKYYVRLLCYVVTNVVSFFLSFYLHLSHLELFLSSVHHIIF